MHPHHRNRLFIVNRIVGVFLLFFSSFNLYASEFSRQSAAVSPAAVFGDFKGDDTTRLFEKFRSHIGRHYALISAETYQQAESEVFQELSASQCTVGYCIWKIQKKLGINRLFLLELTKISDSETETLTQIKVTLVRGEKRIVRETICKNCDPKDLSAALENLTSELITLDIKRSDQAAETNQKKIDGSTPLTEKSGYTENLPWHISAVSMTLISAWQSYNEVDQHNKLVSRNETLEAEYLRLTLDQQAERAAVQDEYDENKQKMAAHQRNIQILDVLTIIGLSWEAYLIYTDYQAVQNREISNDTSDKPITWRFLTAPINNNPTALLSIHWRW